MRSQRFDAPIWMQTRWRVLYEHHGQPTTQIAEQYGVSYSQVRRALIRLGVVMRPPGGRSHRA